MWFAHCNSCNLNISNKFLKDRACKIARNRGHDGYQVGYKFFDKKSGSGISVNEQLAEELYKSLAKKFKEEKSMWDSKTMFKQQI